MKRVIFFTGVLSLITISIYAGTGLRMPVIYTDNMVLQCCRPLPISGTANAGEIVTVTIDGQIHSCLSCADNKWMVTLEPLDPKKTYTLTVETKQEKLVYMNVLAGEVWICSGQSNMAFPLKSSTTGRDDIPKVYHPQIRLFNMIPGIDTNAVEWNASALDSMNRMQYYRHTAWTECTPQTASSFSAVAYYFGKMLADSLDIPIGLICNAIGGSPCEAWIDRNCLEKDFPGILKNWTSNDSIMDWVRERALLNIKKSTDRHQRHPYQPGYLFDTGVRSLSQFPVKGVIWYQGESNAHNANVFEKLFPLMIDSWRQYWNNYEMPFYYVQLSSIDRPDWGLFRDVQRQLMYSIPFVGMAVSIDKGDSLDVHPPQKREIGERLARWALNKTYGYSVVPSGPLPYEVSVHDDTVFIAFKYAENMRTSDGKPLNSFEIADENGVYYPVKAEITGNKVKIKNVDKGISIRYGWQPFTRANLVNEAGLPASTFEFQILNK